MLERSKGLIIDAKLAHDGCIGAAMYATASIGLDAVLIPRLVHDGEYGMMIPMRFPSGFVLGVGIGACIEAFACGGCGPRRSCRRRAHS
jgi:hypothetical protein